MDDILYVVVNNDAPISQELVDKTRALDARSFAILVNRCRELGLGYPELSRLFDMRSGYSSYERAAVDAMSFDVEIIEGKERYFPITEYILQTIPNIRASEILKEAAFANHLITPGALKRRFDLFRIDSSKSVGYINDAVNSSLIPMRTGIFATKRNVFASKPRWVMRGKKSATELRHIKPRKGRQTTESSDLQETFDDLSRIIEDKEINLQDKFKPIPDHFEVDDDVDRVMSMIDDLSHDDAFNASIYGPLNGETYCPTGVGDGHRMLRCMCCSVCSDDPQGQCKSDPFGWFTGVCDSCGKRIKKLSYAVRFPHSRGCFTGCYCSFHCMEEYPAEELDDIILHKLNSLRDSLFTYRIYA